MKRATLGLTLVGGLLAVGLVASPASAASDPYASARTFLSSYGVAAPVQDRLIAEYAAGGSWDSFSSDSAPEKVVTSKTAGYVTNVAHYSDGSVSVSRLELPAKVRPGINSSPNGCTVSGSSRTNCNVDMWVGVVSISFKASYNLSTNKVTNVYGAGWAIGGACSSSLIYLGRPTGNIGRMDVQAQMCGIAFNTTFFLQVTVSGGVATESWSS